MEDKIKVHLKVLDNTTDSEINKLIQQLKKIEGFEFTVDSFVKVVSSDTV